MRLVIHQRSVGGGVYSVANIINVANDAFSKTLRKRISLKKPIRLNKLSKRRRKRGKQRKLRTSQTNKKKQKNQNLSIQRKNHLKSQKVERDLPELK